MKLVQAESSVSQASRSSTSVSNSQDNWRRQKSKFDELFPLFDEMFKLTEMPWLLGLIIVIYVMMQVFAVSMWPGFTYAHHFDDTGGKIVEAGMMITTISDMKRTPESYTLSFLICTGITVITIVVVVAQIIAYSQMRRFVKWSLMIVRFFLEFTPLVLCIPIANFLGSMFLSICEGEADSKTVAYFLITIIYYLFVVGVLYIESTFASISPYISTSPSACWDGSFQFTFLMILSACTFLSYVVQIYGKWLDSVVVCVKILMTVYVIMRMKQHPYIATITNEIICAVFSSSIVLDIVMVMVACGMVIKNSVHLIVLFASLAVSIVAWHFVYRWLVNGMLRALKADSVLEAEGITAEPHGPTKNNMLVLSDVNKREHFTALKLDRDYNSCKGHMRVGLMHMCDLFLDWSLAKYIVEFHDTSAAYAMIAQFICFFPGESRMLKVYYSQLSAKQMISLSERFLLYEIQRISGLRQSSCSSEVTEQLTTMKRLTSRGITATYEFWEHPHDSIEFCYQLRKFSQASCARFGEAELNWPNNVRLSEEHANFLIECCTNFTDGVKQKHRANLIEQGKNFAIDRSFRSLIHVFPAYLKKGFVDMKGNMISKATMKSNTSAKSTSNSSGSHGTGSSASTGFLNGDLDIEIEDEISKSMFSMHRLRLAFQRSLNDRKSKYSRPMKVLALLGAILLIGLTLFLFLYYYSLYNSTKEYMTRLYLMSQIRYGLSMALVALTTHWLTTIEVISPDMWSQLVSAADDRDSNNIHFKRGMINEAVRWTAFGRTGLRDFLAEAVLLGAEGEDVESFLGVMIRSHTKWNFCLRDSIIKYDLDGSLKSILAFMFLRIRELTITYADGTMKSNVSNWASNENLCEVQTNIATVMSSFEILGDAISNKLLGQRDETDSMNKMITIIVIAGYFVIMLIPTVIIIINFWWEIRTVMEMMINLDDQVKKDASKPFKNDSQLKGDGEMNNEPLSTKHLRISTLIAIAVLLITAGAVLLLVILLLATNENDEFFLLNEWLLNGIQRAPYITATLYSLLVGLAEYKGRVTLDYIDWETMKTRVETNVQRLVNANDDLLRGKDGLEGAVGKNADLDDLHFGDHCSGGESMGMHETYRCATIDKLVVTYKTLAYDVLRTPDSSEFEPDSTIYHMIHLMNDHMITLLFQAADILLDNANIQLDSFHLTLTVFLIIGIVYALLQMFIVIYLALQLDAAYAGALQLLRRIPPLACSQHQALLNYLLNKKIEKTDDKMTASKSVIFMSSDSVFCLNRNESIEVMNHSVTSLFGYTPEQLLGQSINAILPEEECRDVFQQMQLMKSGQCAMVFETHGIGKTDDDTSIPVYINLLGIAENGEAKSFAVIIRDETEVQRQKEAAENAKTQSERLLYQILPRDIVVRLNRGESDISFSVPSATIIFIDIIRWSDYSASLSPSQIMLNLSQVFAKFDAVLAKGPLITKIKLIGDVYMAAAGLFTPDEPDSAHASQVVQFGLDALGAIEEVNTELESSLQVRIGVNTDGPLIAGVLGTDKPTFDIIGDPINVAARLQSTCIPSTVQISEMTYHAISEMGFNIEQRGEVELKGKGKRMAYIVRPASTASFFFGSQNSEDTNNITY